MKNGCYVKVKVVVEYLQRMSQRQLELAAVPAASAIQKLVYSCVYRRLHLYRTDSISDMAILRCCNIAKKLLRRICHDKPQKGSKN